MNQFDIIAGSREEHLVAYRAAMMYLIRETGVKLGDVGKMLGDRHYSTVIHSLNSVKAAKAKPYFHFNGLILEAITELRESLLEIIKDTPELQGLTVREPSNLQGRRYELN